MQSNSIWGLGALAALCTHSAVAQQALSLENGPEPRSFVVSVANTTAGSCGAEVDLGDGRVEKRRLEPGETWKIPHAYKADGEYAVALKGTMVMRGLRTVLPCDLNATARARTSQAAATRAPAPSPVAAPVPAVATQAPAASAPAVAPPAPAASAPAVAPPAPAASAPAVVPPAPAAGLSSDPSADLAVFARKGSTSVRFINTIDGSRRLASAQELSRSGYKACLIINASVQKTLPGIDVEGVALSHFERVTLGQNQVRRSMANCVVNGSFVLFDKPDVIVAQTQYLSEMRSSNPAFAEYEEVGEVKFAVLAEASNRAVRAQEERRQAEQAWLAEIDALAASNSKDKVGSLTLSSLRLPVAPGRPSNVASSRAQQGVRICTLDYSGADRQPILGYGYRGWQVFPPTFRANAEGAKWTINPERPFTRLFPSIDEMYATYQQDPEACHVFVDFPKNLRLLMTAIERDAREKRFQLNEVVAAAELRDGWARKNGFQDYAASEFASQIAVDSNTVKRLTDAGVASKASFDSVVKEMISSRYSDKATPTEVLAYLDDKAKAASTPGATAVTVLADRRAKEEAEARARAQRAEAEARARREREEAQKAEAAARAAKEAEAQAAAKKLEAERMARAPELCKTDYKQCMSVEMLVNNFRGLPAARRDCEERTRDVAKWSYRFASTPAFTGYFNSEYEMKQIRTEGIMRLWEDDAEFQNGFGAWKRQRVICFFDIQKMRAITVQAD